MSSAHQAFIKRVQSYGHVLHIWHHPGAMQDPVRRVIELSAAMMNVVSFTEGRAEPDRISQVFTDYRQTG